MSKLNVSKNSNSCNRKTLVDNTQPSKLLNNCSKKKELSVYDLWTIFDLTYPCPLPLKYRQVTPPG